MSITPLTLLIIGLTILLAIIGIWLGSPLAGLWRLPTAFLLVFVAVERVRLTGNYSIQRQLPAILGLGDSVSYPVTITSQANAKLRLESQSDYPDNIDGDNSLRQWSIKANESQVQEFSIVPTQLGAASLGKLYLKQLGAFGLCWWTRAIDDGINFTVEPLRLEKRAAVSGYEHIGNRQQRFQHNTGFELLDLRDYQPGDSLRSIDWKATARRGKQVIRRFEREHHLEIVILIDCGISSRIYCQGLNRLQHYINASAKLTELAAQQGDKIACIAYAQKAVGRVPMLSGISAVKNIRQFLGGLSATNETANPLNAALDVKRILKHRGLIIFLTEIEQPEAAAQLIQAGHLLGAKHKVLIGTLDDPEVANVLTQPARQWLDPYRHFAAFEHQHGQEMSCMQLQRKGIATTKGTVKNLDQQVMAYYQANRDAIGSA